MPNNINIIYLKIQIKSNVLSAKSQRKINGKMAIKCLIGESLKKYEYVKLQSL